MKLIKIIGYLMIIAVLEGALQEYHQVTSAHAHGYHADHHNAASDEPDKEPVHYAWYEIIIMIMQSLWALVIGVIKSIWHTIRTWVELMLIAFECSELVHKLSERFKLGGT